ncbi:hypothetical protein GCM10008957_39460 [Deinococcus ruber]|uniref:Uncharacterized protein n=1 Tax=Deinococcus ruber TaxID=1848197 RepID=A0A918CGB1_9DEIO|nr:hypothetical protein GCM10008957_39460 [Deinococcus ruber]
MEREIETMLTMDGQASTLQWIYQELRKRGCTFEWRGAPYERKFAVVRENRILAEANARSDFYRMKTGLLQARTVLGIQPRR